MIDIEGLTVARGRGRSRTTVLDGVDAHLPAGLTHVVGHSRAGKTTFARVLAGHLREQSGTVRFADRPLTAEQRVEWCALVSGPDTFGTHSTREVLRAARCRPTWDPEGFARLAARFGVRIQGDSRGRGPAESAAFAACVALASGAPVVILDQVVNALDLPMRATLGHELETLRERRNCAVLVTSHAGPDLTARADLLLALSDGRAVQAERTSRPGGSDGNPAGGLRGASQAALTDGASA